MKRGCSAVCTKSIDAKGIMYTTDALLDGDCFPFVLAQAKPN